MGALITACSRAPRIAVLFVRSTEALAWSVSHVLFALLGEDIMLPLLGHGTQLTLFMSFGTELYIVVLLSMTFRVQI